MRWTLTLVAAAILTPSAAPADEKSELKKLEGDYKILSVQRGGKDAPPEVLKSKLNIKGNTFTIIMMMDGQEVKRPITASIDDSKDPKQLDLKLKDKPRYEGVYKLEGKKLTMCYDMVGKERPTKFESPEGTTVTLMVFEKE